MKYFTITLGIFLALAASRFIPHPPNFTSLIALSFYIPLIFGVRYLPALLLSFLITDLIIGFHNTMIFTWGSVLIIGYVAKYFAENIFTRISGALISATIFFIFTNFGVWALGSYGYTFEGFVLCYTLAIPFFTNSIMSTFIFAGIIESIYKLVFNKIKT